ncbi:MAG: hypothetical protein EBU70_12985, partial [Actinobacteria bacterium]|nr:hypothetical protein [Actinomycetota bacterium]
GVTGTPPVIAAVSGRGDTWSVIVSAPGAIADAGTDATATIGLRVVPLGVPVSNARGTALLDPVVYGPNEKYRLDNVAPIFTLSSSGPAGAPHGIGDVTITVRPNEPLSANPVVSVDQAGTEDAPTLATVGIGAYDATWTIRKATGTRPGVDAWVDGTARIGVLGTDLAGNVGSAVVGGSTIEVATSGVFVTGITRSGGAPALVNAGPIRFTVTFSEPVTGDVAGTFAVDPGRGVTGRTPIVTTVSGSGDARVVEVDLTGMVADFGTDRGATLGLRVRAEPVRVSGASGAMLASGVPNGPNERYELDNVGPGFRIAASAPGACAGPSAPGAVCTVVSVTANEALRAAPQVRVVASRGEATDLGVDLGAPAATPGVGPWSAIHRALPAAGSRALVETVGVDLAGNPGRRIQGPDTFATGVGATCPADGTDGDGYERYLVELPTRDDTSPQVW